MEYAAPGSALCKQHHLADLTRQRSIKRRRGLCGCGAQPDPGYRTCARCRSWATWRKRGQRNPALRLVYETQQFIVAYLEHGNAARAAREAKLGTGPAAARKGLPSPAEALHPRSARGTESREPQQRSASSRRRCAGGGAHSRGRARQRGTARAGRLARASGSRSARAQIDQAAASRCHARRRAALPRGLEGRRTIAAGARVSPVPRRARTP